MKITVSLLIKFLSIMHLNSASDNRIKIFTVTRQVPDIIKITVFQSISWQVNWNKHFLIKGFCFAKLPLSTTKMSHNIERPCGFFMKPIFPVSANTSLQEANSFQMAIFSHFKTCIWNDDMYQSCLYCSVWLWRVLGHCYLI